MVQLPATAAIEYVAACCRTRTRTKTKTGTKTKIGTITKSVRGAYAHSPQVQCIYAPSRLSVPSILEWRTNIHTKKRETRPRSSTGSWPPLPKFSGYVEVDAPDIFHPSTIWVRPLFTQLGPKNPHFAKKQTNICRLSGDITTCNEYCNTDLPGGICPSCFFQMTVTSGSAFDWQRNRTSDASWTVTSFGPSMILGRSVRSVHCTLNLHQIT